MFAKFISFGFIPNITAASFENIASTAKETLQNPPGNKSKKLNISRRFGSESEISILKCDNIIHRSYIFF